MRPEQTASTSEGATGAGSGTSKRIRNSSETLTSAEKRPTKRHSTLPEMSYKDAVSNFNMTIVREKYPEDMLVEVVIKDIQSEILRKIDGAKPRELLPLLRTYSLQEGAIFVTTKNLATGFPLTSMEPNLGTSLS